jgi:hypothetical protein
VERPSFNHGGTIWITALLCRQNGEKFAQWVGQGDAALASIE